MVHSTDARPPQPKRIRIAPSLLEALRELAADEGLDLNLLVTLLIRAGLDHHRGRA